MTTEDLIPKLAQVLKAYTDATGREASIIHYEYSLLRFSQAGFTWEDMKLVCEHLVRENRKRPREFQSSLKLSPLLSDTEKFADLLSECRALERNRRPKPTPAEAIKEAWSPTVVPGGLEPSVTTPAMTNLIKAMKEAAK